MQAHNYAVLTDHLLVSLLVAAGNYLFRLSIDDPYDNPVVEVKGAQAITRIDVELAKRGQGNLYKSFLE